MCTHDTIDDEEVVDTVVLELDMELVVRDTDVVEVDEDSDGVGRSELDNPPMMVPKRSVLDDAEAEAAEDVSPPPLKYR